MGATPDLGNRLDKLAQHYRSSYLNTDPVGLIHRYGGTADREVAGLVVSVLSYGGAEQIRRSAERALACAGPSPAAFARRGMDCLAGKLAAFKHRWTTGAEIAVLFRAAGDILEEYGSIGACVRGLDDPGERTIGGVMDRFARLVVSRVERHLGGIPGKDASGRPTSYLVPSPAGGSACKRLAMFFRWMVRGPDGVDFGLWKCIDTSRLVIPVDRHIARMGSRLGLTERTNPDWKMAVEITDALRTFDPADPVRYDFALVRPGIMGRCGSPGQNGCGDCALHPFCGERQ